MSHSISHFLPFLTHKSVSFLSLLLFFSSLINHSPFSCCVSMCVVLWNLVVVVEKKKNERRKKQ